MYFLATVYEYRIMCRGGMLSMSVSARQEMNRKKKMFSELELALIIPRPERGKKG